MLTGGLAVLTRTYNTSKRILPGGRLAAVWPALFLMLLLCSPSWAQYTGGQLTPPGNDTTVVMPVNPVGAVKVTNLGCLESGLNLVATGFEISCLAFGLVLFVLAAIRWFGHAQLDSVGGGAITVSLSDFEAQPISVEHFKQTATGGRPVSLFFWAGVVMAFGLLAPGFVTWSLQLAQYLNLLG